MGARYLRLRLDVISTNACRKFHRDAVTARLLCTYRGSATQIGNASNDQDPHIIKQIPSGTPYYCGERCGQSILLPFGA